MKEPKRMLGEKIYHLRKEKGLSQSELGDLLGVSNKAVSKWETDEANPEISLLPKIARIFGITIDDLLENADDDVHALPKTKIFGFIGDIYKDSGKYEFISDRKTKKGKPYLHINIGKNLENIGAKAEGVIAIGNRAKGLISLGFISSGLFSLGIISIGLFAIGIVSLAAIAFGTIALGILSMGAIAVGIIAVGAIAIGYLSFGALAIGYHAYTTESGKAFGKYIYILSQLIKTFFNCW